MKRWPKPDGDRGYPGQPDGIVGGPALGLPAGNRGTGTEAEELLASAVGWWDVASFCEGDRWLRNRGVAGPCLDMRLGSSTLPNSNDPLLLRPEDAGYAYLPGVNGNYLSVPDEASLRTTGDLDVRALVRPSLAWNSATANGFVARYGSPAARSYCFYSDYYSAAGQFIFAWYDATDVLTTVYSTTAPAYPADALLWVRVTLDLDNGAGKYEVKFYTSLDGTVWSQLGTTITGAAATTLRPGSSAVEIGSRVNGTWSPCLGKVYRAQIYNGINGTCVLDVDCNAITSGSQTSFLAATGQTVTINRATSGRKAVAMPSRNLTKSPLMLFGTDDYCEVQGADQHRWLNFGAGQPFTAVIALREWSTPTTNRRYICKRGPNGWTLAGEAGTTVGLYFDDVRGRGANATGSMVYGALSIMAGRRSVATRTATFGGTTVAASTASLATSFPTAVGRDSGGTLYFDGELFAAAIFRRALSDREIAVITDYYNQRIA